MKARLEISGLEIVPECVADSIFLKHLGIRYCGDEIVFRTVHMEKQWGPKVGEVLGLYARMPVADIPDPESIKSECFSTRTNPYFVAPNKLTVEAGSVIVLKDCRFVGKSCNGELYIRGEAGYKESETTGGST